PLGLFFAVRWTPAVRNLVLASPMVLLAYIFDYWSHNSAGYGTDRWIQIGCFVMAVAAPALVYVAGFRHGRPWAETRLDGLRHYRKSLTKALKQDAEGT